MYAGSCSPRHVEDASISPLKPQLPQPFASLGAIIAPPDFRACAVRRCCCGGAARGFTRAGAMSDNDDIEVESDVSWAPNPGTIPGITPPRLFPTFGALEMG